MKNPLNKGLLLEYITLCWNVIGCVILITIALKTSSLSLFGFGIDSVIEIAASLIVIWQLKAINKSQEKIATRLIGISFLLLSLYIVIQSFFSFEQHIQPQPSIGGIVWLALTAITMFILAYGKNKVGREINHPVLLAEAKVTMVDGLLSVSVLIGVLLRTYLGWWWIDIIASLVIAFYGIWEAFQAFLSSPEK